MIKPGDKCFVRIHTGEIVEAIYEHRFAFGGKRHVVLVDGLTKVTTDGLASLSASQGRILLGQARFVAMHR